MFETTVKHFVYDFCIGIVFEKWQSNFVSLDGKSPKIGDFFTRISHMMSDEHYYGCKVKNVVKKTTKDGQPYHLVYITYSSSGGVAVEEWEEEINEFLEENDINLDEFDSDSDEESDEPESDYDIIDDELEELMNDEDIEYMEYPDMICLNSLYYVFYK